MPFFLVKFLETVCSSTQLTMSLLISRNDLQKIFEKLDKNNDGFVSLDELNWLLDKISVHLSLAELGTMLGKPTLDFNEFIFFYDSISENKNGDSISSGGKDEEKTRDVDLENDLVQAFQVFDMNNDGFISSDELQSVLSRLGLWDEASGRDCRNMIRVYDINQDGRLDFEEFKSMMMLTIS